MKLISDFDGFKNEKDELVEVSLAGDAEETGEDDCIFWIVLQFHPYRLFATAWQTFLIFY